MAAKLLPRFSESYEFSVFSSDGVRLWVNNQLIINDFTEHPPLERSASINLVAGQEVELHLEYFKKQVGPAPLQL